MVKFNYLVIILSFTILSLSIYDLCFEPKLLTFDEIIIDGIYNRIISDPSLLSHLKSHVSQLTADNIHASSVVSQRSSLNIEQAHITVLYCQLEGYKAIGSISLEIINVKSN